MWENTNLFDLINRPNDEIDSYLGSVSPKQFIVDVKQLIGKNINKDVIEETIQKLKTLI
jgi:hypothetical protein